MADRRVSTGVAGLDEVLQGGFLPGRAYLLAGKPGTGKTTLGWHFLTAGAEGGGPSLFITLGETQGNLRRDAANSGFDVGEIDILDLSPTSELFSEVETYDIFSPAEVERAPTTERIVEAVSTLKPARVFVDSMTQLRYLAPDAFQFRRQALSFLRYLVDGGTTLLFTSEASRDAPDDDLRFLADGVLELELGARGRVLTVSKFRGSGFQGLRHTIRLGEGGMEVFPRLVTEGRGRDFTAEPLPSGVPGLDELLQGGLERGTVTMVSGPSGVGKTTFGLQFMKEAAGRGERSVLYTFEEGAETLVARCEQINIPVRQMIERGTLAVVPVEPMQLSADELTSLVRGEVEERDAKIVMIDSVRGFEMTLRGEDASAHLHALCRYLHNMGVTSLLVNEVQAVTDFRITELGVSYLADNIVFLRYLERDFGDRIELRKAVGVLKKRLSDFEKTLREFEITPYGVQLGAPMQRLRGILSELPQAWEHDGPAGRADGASQVRHPDGRHPPATW
jgi:circadian clock protein KaiC